MVQQAIEELRARQGQELYTGFTQIAVSGPTRFGGLIQEDFLPELNWPRAYKVYNEMRKNSAVVGGFLRAIESAFRSTQWYTRPYSKGPEHAERARFLEECIHDMARPWNDVITDILTMLPFGFAPMEMVFKFRQGRSVQYPVPKSKYNDGRVGLKDLVLIPQNEIMEWVYDLPDNPCELLGIRQITSSPAPGGPSIINIPASKIVNFRPRAEKDSPVGESILRTAYRSYYFQSNLEVIEAISLERTGAGIPVIGLPAGATTILDSGDQSDEARALKIVKQVRADEQAGIVKPDGWTFDIVTSKGLRPELFDLAIKRHRANLLISVLAVFLELGTARVGSNAMLKGGKSFFEVAFDGWVMGVEQTFNNKVVPLLFALNGIEDEPLPELAHTTLAGEDLEALISSVEKLVSMSLLDTSAPALRTHFHHLLRLPHNTVEEEFIPESEKDAGTHEGEADSGAGGEESLLASPDPTGVPLDSGDSNNIGESGLPGGPAGDL